MNEMPFVMSLVIAFGIMWFAVILYSICFWWKHRND